MPEEINGNCFGASLKRTFSDVLFLISYQYIDDCFRITLITLLTEYCSVELFGGLLVGTICHDVTWTSREQHPAILYFSSHLLVAQANGCIINHNTMCAV